MRANGADFDGVWRVWGTVDPRSGEWQRGSHRVQRTPEEQKELHTRWPPEAWAANAGRLLKWCWLDEFVLEFGDDHTFCHCLRVHSTFFTTV